MAHCQIHSMTPCRAKIKVCRMLRNPSTNTQAQLSLSPYTRYLHGSLSCPFSFSLTLLSYATHARFEPLASHLRQSSFHAPPQLSNYNTFSNTVLIVQLDAKNLLWWPMVIMLFLPFAALINWTENRSLLTHHAYPEEYKAIMPQMKKEIYSNHSKVFFFFLG